jgi:hypothetical protein
MIELKIFLSGLGKSNVYHLIESEHQYNFIGKFKGRNKIVCTFHQPIEFYEENYSPARLERMKRIDHAIVLSKELIPKFEKYVGKGNVSFFPLGVDSGYFKPDQHVIKDIDVILIGNWLRDFKLGREIFNRLNSKQKLNNFVLTQSTNFHHFDNIENLECVSNISDEELLTLYHRSKMVLLPLKSAVANTSLIETICAGLIVCISDIDSVFDYVKRDHVIIINPENLDQTVNDILNHLNDDSLRIEKQTLLQKDIEFVHWDNVGQRIEAMYASLFENERLSSR